MASNVMAPEALSGDDSHRPELLSALAPALQKLLRPLASLKLTVALFAMAIFLVLIGTLAQAHKDIWEVLNQYFRVVIARVDLQDFFPPAFFSSKVEVPGYFYFPGGFLIGTLMCVNLLAAHGLRFKPQAKGARLWGGLTVIVVGGLLTWVVIVGGTDKAGVQDLALVEWSTLWTLCKVSLLAAGVALGYFAKTMDADRKLERRALAAASAAATVFALWLFYRADITLGGPSLRIMWQLLKGGFAGLVLLAGCYMVFRKRAGVVLLHAGVGLMMANELVVYFLHEETNLTLFEGEKTNWAQDIRTVELAFIDSSDPKNDNVVVVPKSFLKEGSKFSDEKLPFEIEVEKFIQNADLVPIKKGDKSTATVGTGLKLQAVEHPPSTGTDTDAKVDTSAAYVKLSKDGKSLGTYLLGVELHPQPIEADGTPYKVDGKSYDVALRFKRVYKSYQVALKDVREDNYMGTNTPQNYSSDIRLIDPAGGTDREVHIWMNNPLRYAGDTLYQSGYHRDTGHGEATTLQVVSNYGWMIPYVSCMLVATGMLAHFSGALARFLRRRSEASDQTLANRRRAAKDIRQISSPARVWVPVLTVLIFGGYALSKARPPKTPDGEMNLYQVGQIPVMYEGRVKPFDTLARTTLRSISDRQTCDDEEAEAKSSDFHKKLVALHLVSPKKMSATQWLLDVITDRQAASKHKVFRIESLEVLDTLGLERRSGFRYAIDEFEKKIPELAKQAALAHAIAEKDKAELNVYQKKIVELESKLRLYMLMVVAFEPPPISKDNAAKDVMEAIQHHGELMRMQPPLAVPPSNDEDKWEPYTIAWTKDFARLNLLNQPANPLTMDLNKILVAYGNGDAKTFNEELARYQSRLEEKPPKNYDEAKVGFEAFFNVFEPFYYAAILYIFAFLLLTVSWLRWTPVLNRAAFWLILFTFALHSWALISRIYISGRPPVTNLYSSAVFIGWGAVLLGIGLELVYKLGIGNIVAAVAGFATLLIAHFLASSGDTFIVLRAVLDTQFWLATHVTCVTMGYVATYVAGILGLVYILRGLLTSSLTPEVGKDLLRMIYGTVCFAMFFSFVGTVLGGLWADDSWGRFWGWDPKENGALIIVLWNALVLHARWDGMVRDRGLAALAVGGNIVTSWSWFGVNELGIGLHNYGFTEGVLLALIIFCLTQIVVIAMAMVPKDHWVSSQSQQA